MEREWRHNRRQLLGVAGTAVAVALAGCASNGDDEPDEPEDDDGDDPADDPGDEPEDGEDEPQDDADDSEEEPELPEDDDSDEAEEEELEPQTIDWYAGTEGGTYYPLSVEFGEIVEETTDHTVAVHTSGGSVENVEALGREEATFALVQNDLAFFARRGTPVDEFDSVPIERLEGVATLYPETVHVVIRPDAGISSLADLQGASVNTGSRGSGTRINALQLLESAAELTPEEFDEQNAASGPAAEKLRTGELDAAFAVGGWPAGAVEELATTTDIELLELDESEREAAMADTPWFATDTIPAGTYAGVENDVATVSARAMIATRSEVPAALVEVVANTIFDNADALTLKAEFVDRETALDGMSIPLHEGAERAFE